MTQHSGTVIACAALLLVAPLAARAAPADANQVEQILSDEGLLPAGGATTDHSIDQAIDNAATAATAQLGGGDPNWGPTNAHWTQVYDHVRADFAAGESEATAAAAAARPTAVADYASDIAAHLDSSDGDAILAYFGSPEGRSYLDFLQRVNAIMASGAATLAAHEPPSPTQPTQQQMDQDHQMLELSVAFQMAAKANTATGDPAAGSGVGYMIAAAINKNQTELQSLAAQYGADLPRFETFTRSDPAQHFFTAMTDAGVAMAKEPNPVAQWIGDTTAQHQADWTAYYQSVTSH